MLTTPTGYYDAILAGNEVNVYAIIDGTIYDNSSIISVAIEQGVNDEYYRVGTAQAAFLRLVINNDVNSLLVDSKTVQIFVTVENGDTQELLVGTFYIESVTRNQDRLTMIGYDKMAQLEQEYISALSYPASLSSILAEVLTGFSYSISLPSHLTSGTFTELKNYTKRQALAIIAGLCGGFAHVDRSNENIKIKTPSTTPGTSPSLTIDTPFNFNRSDAATTITGIALTDGTTTYNKGTTTGFVLKIDNPYATDAIATGIYNAVNGTPMLTYRANYLVNPALELGDAIVITDYSTTEDAVTDYAINVGAIAISFDVNLFGAVGNVGEGKTKNSYQTTGDLVSRFNRIDASKITTGFLSADYIQGGTLSLGGYNNQNGILKLYDNSNALVGELNKLGLTFYGTYEMELSPSGIIFTGGGVSSYLDGGTLSLAGSSGVIDVSETNGFYFYNNTFGVDAHLRVSPNPVGLGYGAKLSSSSFLFLDGIDGIRFFTNNSADYSMAIATNGKVTIGGTATADTLLQLNTGGSFGYGLTIRASGQTGTRFAIGQQASGLSFATTTNGSSYTERMALDSTGLLVLTNKTIQIQNTGNVTQGTSKATAVTANTFTGLITMNAASLAANTTVAFTLNNSNIETSDTVIVHRDSGGTGAGAYFVWVDSVSAGSCVINVRNMTAGALAEQPIIRFTLIKTA